MFKHLKLSQLAFFIVASLASNLLQAQTYEQEFQQRASILIDQVATKYNNLRPPGFQNTGNPTDPEKYNWPQVMARLSKLGLNDDTSNARLDRFKNNSPFHFTLVGMARIMNQFPNAPQMAANKQTYLSKIFGRTDGYNAFTDEGTENHNNMARTSGYLAAQNALGNAAFPTAATRLAGAKQWIMEFSKRLYFVGASEWNSSQYGSYNLIGWLNLFDFAQDPEVKAAARAVLDYYALELGLHYSQGWTGGSEMRSSGVPAYGVTGGNPTNVFGTSAQDFQGWFWFGDLSKDIGKNYWQGNEYIQSVHAALSTYRPPSYAIQLAKKQITLPAWFKASKGEYFGTTPSYLHQHFYADLGYNLGAAYMPYGGWGGGCIAIQSWKLMGRVTSVSGDTVKAPQIITGSGKYYSQTRGRGRQPYDQFVQHKNVLIQMTKLPTNFKLIDTSIIQIINSWKTQWLTSFNQRFPGDTKGNPVNKQTRMDSVNQSYISYPGNATVIRSGNVVFVDMENAFVAIRSLGKALPGNPKDDGNLTRKMVLDTAALGSVCGFALEAANKTVGFTFANFQTAIAAKAGLNKSQLASGKVKYISLQNDTIEAQYVDNGSHKEPIFDWGYGPNTPQIIQTTPPYLQPTSWPTTNGGRVASWKVNGDPVVLDGNWPVYQGPGVSLTSRILRLEGDSAGLNKFYQADYTGAIPVFTSGIVTSNVAIERPKEIETQVYPNPANGSFTIILADKAVAQSVDLYSLEGVLVKRFGKASGKNTFSGNGLKPGLYILKISSDDISKSVKLMVN